MFRDGPFEQRLKRHGNNAITCPSNTVGTEQKNIKVAMVGESGVGSKTSAHNRFIKGDFTPSLITTIGIDFKFNNVELGGHLFRAQIWDSAGQERFHSNIASNMFIRGTLKKHSIVIGYDVTQRETFHNLKRRWFPAIFEQADKDVCIILVANKVDLDDQRMVSTEEGRKFAQEMTLERRRQAQQGEPPISKPEFDGSAFTCFVPFVEISAKIGVGVDEAFHAWIIQAGMVTRALDPTTAWALLESECHISSPFNYAPWSQNIHCECCPAQRNAMMSVLGLAMVRRS